MIHTINPSYFTLPVTPTVFSLKIQVEFILTTSYIT